MVRPLRIEYENALYHIIAHGNEGRDLFLDSNDYQKFLSLLASSHERYKVVVHCYCLMSNHYHLTLETPLANLSKTMHYLQSSYTIYFNRRHERIGHLFQGRYKSILVEKESYLLELSLYVHLNPVKAGLVTAPEDYDWSSYRMDVGIEKPRPWLKQSWILGQLADDEREAMGLHRGMIEERIHVDVDPLRNVYAQTLLGRPPFIERIKRKIKGIEESPELPRLRDIKRTIRLEDLAEKVRRYYNIDKDELYKCKKKKNKPRNVAIYLTRRYTPLDLYKIGEYFGGISYSAVSQIAKRVEEERSESQSLNKEIIAIEAEIT